jgi:hypothetical protein
VVRGALIEMPFTASRAEVGRVMLQGNGQ